MIKYDWIRKKSGRTFPVVSFDFVILSDFVYSVITRSEATKRSRRSHGLPLRPDGLLAMTQDFSRFLHFFTAAGSIGGPVRGQFALTINSESH